MNERMRKKIVKMLNHAYTTVPIYMNRIESIDKLSTYDSNTDEFYEDIVLNHWEELPTITKKEYQKNDCDYGMAINYYPELAAKKLTSSSTSGSSGMCMNSYWSDRTYKESLMELWILRKKRYGINANDKLCYFYSVYFGAEEEKDGILFFEDKNELAINKSKFNSKENIIKIIEMIKEYSPDWMMLQPSLAVRLSDVVMSEKLELPKSINYIELTGELLTEDDRRVIEDTFRCNVANQYGCHELSTIAYECKNKKMHCMASNAYVEVIKDGKSVYDTEGEIYVTSLINDVMPFVRYATNDIGILRKSTCSCGAEEPILMVTKGRTTSWVLHEDGRRTSSYVFIETVEKVNAILGRAIKQFKVVQLSLEKIIIKAVIDEELDEDQVFDCIFEYLSDEITDDFDIYFENCEELNIDENTGKYSIFESKI